MAGAAEFVQVEDVSADGDADVRSLAACEGAVGEALQREADRWVVGGVDPTFPFPEVWLRLQILTSGAEALSIRIVSMAGLKPCPFKEETADPSLRSG